jgi:hypothetical protein
MRMTDRIEFDGQGGTAGVGTGVTAVRPTPAEGGTLLDYDVTTTTDGTLARTGS